MLYRLSLLQKAEMCAQNSELPEEEKLLVLIDNFFFAQSVRIKLAWPQAAQLSIHFFPGKSVVLHLCEGPD